MVWGTGVPLQVHDKTSLPPWGTSHNSGHGEGELRERWGVGREGGRERDREREREEEGGGGGRGRGGREGGRAGFHRWRWRKRGEESERERVSGKEQEQENESDEGGKQPFYSESGTCCQVTVGQSLDENPTG